MMLARFAIVLGLLLMVPAVHAQTGGKAATWSPSCGLSSPSSTLGGMLATQTP
jgi:hypothetical protein